jgi:hypothetical protein
VRVLCVRVQLWRIHLPPNAPLAPDVDLAKLAGRFAFAGGNIKNVCFKAASRAALRLDNAKITMDDRTLLLCRQIIIKTTQLCGSPVVVVWCCAACSVGLRAEGAGEGRRRQGQARHDLLVMIMSGGNPSGRAPCSGEVENESIRRLLVVSFVCVHEEREIGG